MVAKVEDLVAVTPGDKNALFFHLRASQRRRKNKITKLRTPDGQLTKDMRAPESCHVLLKGFVHIRGCGKCG